MTGVGERYLVVSLGSIGRRHLQNLRRLRPESQLGIWHLRASPDGLRLPEGADFVFDSAEQAIAFDPVAAIVAGPASTHLTVARSLAEAGVHLLVEKPLACSPDGVAELLDIARQRGINLMTGYNVRFLPSLQVAKECLDGGMIGRVLSVRAEVGQFLPDWRAGTDYRSGVSARRELGGGALLELSHELDYLCWMFGMPARVTARGGRYSDLEIDVEDVVEITLEYDSPPRLVNVHLDMVQRAPHRCCRFIGSEGTLVWDGILDRVDAYRVSAAAWTSIAVPALVDRNQMYLDELQHFLESIRKGTRPIVDGNDGLRALVIAAAARNSMERDVGVELVARVD